MSALKRRDDPVAVAAAVGVQSRLERVGLVLGVAGHVEPVPAPALAVVRRGQQPVDHLGEGVGRLVGQERLDLLRRRRQADQVERRPRRSSVRRSAGGGRAALLLLELAPEMKRSMDVSRARRCCRPAAADGCFTGRNDQNARSFSVILSPRGAAGRPPRRSGQGRPSSPRPSGLAICSSESFRLGGIRGVLSV